MLYSVRMRSAQGGDHAAGGRHISGAERMVPEVELAAVTQAMLSRALTHSRGCADFINVVVEKIEEEQIHKVPLLAMTTVPVADVATGRQAAKELLVGAGVARVAVEQAFKELLALPDSMRGAMLLDAQSGRRLDELQDRGVRVSRMDIAEKEAFSVMLQDQRLNNDHVREALVLAAKVAAAPGMVAELCWSDDPEYTAGYIASTRGGYYRFPYLKEYGCPIGGRVFFVNPAYDLTALIDYLERQPVLVTVPPEGDAA